MSAFLLDTNVLSELTRPRPEPNVVRFLRTQANLWISVISLHEFSYGIARMADPTRKARLQAWLQDIEGQFVNRTIPLDQAIANLAGQLRASAESKGRACEALDAFIGATALKNDLTLVTRNTKDFDGFGAKVVNPWD